MHEPMTMATDYLLGGVTLVLAIKLLLQGRRLGERSVMFWGVAFALSSTAAFVGGTYHAFTPSMTAPFARALWLVTLIALSLGSLTLLIGSILAFSPQKLRSPFLVLAVLKCLAFTVFILRKETFLYAIAEYGSTLLVILVMQLARWRTTSSGPWLIAGVFVSVIAALIQQSGVIFHRHFNYNDLYHLVQIGAMWLIYRAGLLIRDSLPSPACEVRSGERNAVPLPPPGRGSPRERRGEGP